MTAGRVSVNGVVTMELGAKVDPRVDIVTVDGVRICAADGPTYLVLNKPAGVVTTMSDPQGRPTVASLVPGDRHPGLFPVGRLDADTTGLLLFTTDGELGHRLLHPNWKVPKTYIAVVDGKPDACDMQKLREGIELDDGKTAPAGARTIERRTSTSVIEVVLREGRKRQVRRMLSAVSHPVIELERVSFGPIELGTLARGEWRYLTDAEVAELLEATSEKGSE